MRAIHLLPLLFLTLACACGGGGDKEVPSKTESVTVTPTSLSCDLNEQTLTLDVTASGAFQVFPADGVSWVTVEPAYSAASSAKVSVKVAKNDTYLDRETTITVKCGTTREKVTLSQSGGEVDIDMPEGYHLVWRDEFSEGSVPSSQWWYETGAGGWGNNEIQEYVAQNKDGKDIAYVSNGTLKIAAQKIDNKVYSVRMNTTPGWTYGWFEARIKVTDARGSWPAFWMMPKNFKTWPGDGEIDIMEYAIGTQGKNKSSSSIHCAAFNWPAGTQKTHVQSVNNAASEFHVYALEWMADKMIFYVDGKAHLTFDNDGQGYEHWPFNAPFYLKLNLAWGGNMGGTAVDADLPAVYEIDYVRVFQKD